MPLYEYDCAACGERFERIQKFSDPPEAVCPKCGGSARRRLSPPTLQFKGSGWYVTDYARKPTPPEKPETSGEIKSEGQKSSPETRSRSDSKASTE